MKCFKRDVSTTVATLIFNKCIFKTLSFYKLSLIFLSLYSNKSTIKLIIK